MESLYYLLVPFSIAVIGFILHYGWKYLVWRKELKRDEKIRKELDDLLGNSPGCENEELLLTHPKDWEVNCCPN